MCYSQCESSWEHHIITLNSYKKYSRGRTNRHKIQITAIRNANFYSLITTRNQQRRKDPQSHSTNKNVRPPSKPRHLFLSKSAQVFVYKNEGCFHLLGRLCQVLETSHEAPSRRRTGGISGNQCHHHHSLWVSCFSFSHSIHLQLFLLVRRTW